jgi:hypothetical protein
MGVLIKKQKIRLNKTGRKAGFLLLTINILDIFLKFISEIVNFSEGNTLA